MELRETIREMLAARFPGAAVEVSDMTGSNDHFDERVTSADFAGKALLEQHRMVIGVLRERLGSQVHAVRIRTAAPGAGEGA